MDVALAIVFCVMLFLVGWGIGVAMSVHTTKALLYSKPEDMKADAEKRRAAIMAEVIRQKADIIIQHHIEELRKPPTRRVLCMGCSCKSNAMPSASWPNMN